MENKALIILDTTRDDYFDFSFDGLKRFKTFSPSFWTPPSHASIFTGLYPSQHNVRESVENKRDLSKYHLKEPRLLKEMSKDGYKLYALSANPFITPPFGYRGWDYFKFFTPFSDYEEGEMEEYYEVWSQDNLMDEVKYLIKRGKIKLLYKKVNEFVSMKTKWKLLDPIDMGGGRLLKSLKKVKLEEPFFLFINLMESHDPNYRGEDYERDQGLSYLGMLDGKTMKKFRRGYERKVKRAQKYLGEILHYLRDFRVKLVVTSDHGQLLGEKGLIGHSYLTFETVEVPVLIKEECSGVINLTKLIQYFLNGEKPCSRYSISEMFALATPSPYKYGRKEDVMKWEKRLIAVSNGSSSIIYNPLRGVIEEYKGNELEVKRLEEVARNFHELNS